MIVFSTIKVKSPVCEYKNQIYHTMLLELYFVLSGTNKQHWLNAIHCYAAHNGWNGEDSLEGGSNGVSCLACQHNWGQKHSFTSPEWAI